MYAIIATGGKQYKVAEGDVIKVERLGAAAGEAVTFDQVLAVNNGEMKIGCPTVEGATVSATVVKEGKGKKVIVYKYKRKSGYHKKNGHTRWLTSERSLHADVSFLPRSPPYPIDRKSTRLNSSHVKRSRMPSSA